MKKSIVYIATLLFFTLYSKAQTSNEGMLYVSENTKFSTVERFDNLTTGSFYNDGNTFIYSHFNNDGTIDFYQNTGITRFVGNSNQAIRGSKISYLYNVLFNNRSATVPFQLYGNIDISGETEFFEGIVDNDNFGGEITFNTNASHINTSDYSHVDGEVNKFGDTEFTFPIGDGGYYRFGGISAPVNNTAVFEGKFYFENSNDLYPHDLKAGIILEIDNQEYWTIEKESSTKEDVLITLSWRDVTTPQSMISAAERETLTIVRWDEATNMWVNEGGAIDINNQTVTAVATGYGVFTFARIVEGEVLGCSSLAIYNAVSPNGDGMNDYFRIDVTDDCARDMHVLIFNRWGVKVFETDNYGPDGDVFDGTSTGRVTVKAKDRLPTGTYFYILNYEYGDPAVGNRHKQTGFLYLN
ncbi:gliding motility-associated C-terminal domain-containing protein [Aequorivita sp. F47161]|uniref:Gliding motility-associated C-terminal domain-containing protein n=1 Tax=Aequorivita vitellina TaxID=2874475 RepID=A0A9X1QVT3_9FLAO|nr:gliding motility-associated C-terminal domain-containing protein [Aequorivita vitellina]MCG2418719.1 gliding motility-associated C-terminal domain-containing protein [Aequorivita vitellina]